MMKVAILDLYDGVANQGMRCIRNIINDFAISYGIEITTTEFDVRGKLEVPGTEFDLYISSGGPGSPLDSEGSAWDNLYFDWFRQMEEWNAQSLHVPKKQVFFICHSFQLVCRHYKLAEVCKRRSTSFGVFPIHPITNIDVEPVLAGLPNPFYAVDSRDYQVIKPNHQRLRELGATLLCIEKDRPHIALERAIMAIRFNNWFFGTQFHPEADAEGMSMYLQIEEKKKTVIENHGEAKWISMIDHLSDPDKILYTYSHILPNFLHEAMAARGNVSAEVFF